MSDNTHSTTRTCFVCHQTFPLTKEYFRYVKDKNGKYYFQHQCLTCVRERDRQRYAENGGAAKMRDWRHKNPVKAKAAKKRDEARHPETVKARKQRSHIRCRDKNNERGKRWNEQNKEHVRQVSHEYYQEHRQEILAYQDQWRRDNPEKFKATQNRHRSRKRNAPGTHTAADIAFQVAAQTDKRGRLHCWWCGDVISDAHYHLDHKHPLARGGTNEAENIVISCPTCNLKKHTKTPQEWAGRLL